MIEFASKLDQIFGSSLAQGLTFLLVLIFIVVAIYKFFRSIRKARDEQGRINRPRLEISFVITIVVAAFVVFSFVKYGANQMIDEKLLSGVVSVEVDGNSLQEFSRLVVALKTPCLTNGRRSHPTTVYDVLVKTNSGNLELRIGKDSVVSTDYWVFYPNFGLTKENEVRRACDTGLNLQ